jgi:hypothetical protein
MAKNPTTRETNGVQERRCTVCDRWLPETKDHFAWNSHYQRYNSWDRDCVKAFVIYRKDNDAVTARKLTRKAVLSGKLPEKPARKVAAKKAAGPASAQTEPVLAVDREAALAKAQATKAQPAKAAATKAAPAKTATPRKRTLRKTANSSAEAAA